VLRVACEVLTHLPTLSVQDLRADKRLLWVMNPLLVHDECFLRDGRHGAFRYFLAGHNLTSSKLSKFLGSKSEADLLNLILSQVLMFVNLVASLLPRVHIEVLVLNDDLLVKLVQLPLLHLLSLLDHVFSRDEHRLEVTWLRERLLVVLHLAHEVSLAVFFGMVDLTFQLILFVHQLLNVGNLKIFDHGSRRLLRVLVVVGLLHDIVKAAFRLPAFLIRLLSFHLDFVFIDDRERK